MQKFMFIIREDLAELKRTGETERFRRMRIMYEDLLARVSRGPLESQRLLIPPTVAATAAQIALGWLLAKRKFDLEQSARQTADMFVRGMSRQPQPAVESKS